MRKFKPKGTLRNNRLWWQAINKNEHSFTKIWATIKSIMRNGNTRGEKRKKEQQQQQKIKGERKAVLKKRNNNLW